MSARLRFAILTHDHPELHWDLMFELSESLRTWRLSERPDRANSIKAEALPPHRLLYLDYEGPVSGGRGRVSRFDGGTYELREDSDDLFAVVLDGAMIRGEFRIQRNGRDWLLLRIEQARPEASRHM